MDCIGSVVVVAAAAAAAVVVGVVAAQTLWSNRYCWCYIQRAVCGRLDAGDVVAVDAAAAAAVVGNWAAVDRIVR